MGQAKKRRACPALNREIPAAECGANRHVRYACPETCAFNPFAPANYAELLEIDGGVDLALMKRLHAADRMAITRLRAAEKENRGHGFHAAAVWHLHGKRDAEGLTVAERWAREGSGGGRNDEQLLLRGKLQMRIALLEVRRVLDAQRFEAIDLLEPDGAPRVFLDRSVGARAARFSTFLTWVYPLPHFWRMSGSGIGFDDVTPFPARETIAALVAHLGGPAELAAQRRWLAEHFVRIDEALAETGLERRRRMFAMMDTTWVAATYELRAPFDAARARLLGAPGVLDEEPSKEESAQGMLGAAVWLDDQPSVGRQFAQAGAGQPVAGRVLLGAKEWRVEGLGAKRVGRVRAAFEAWMGERVAFVRERRDDLNARMASDDPGPNVALVPPRLLERIMPLDV
ncbi:MAG: hypothetical protein FJ399_17145, partial [Verrucomicrobia bacterium]|nr:hypothetical protein [Verrucomicrobiota bacterium]